MHHKSMIMLTTEISTAIKLNQLQTAMQNATPVQKLTPTMNSTAAISQKLKTDLSHHPMPSQQSQSADSKKSFRVKAKEMFTIGVHRVAKRALPPLPKEKNAPSPSAEDQKPTRVKAKDMFKVDDHAVSKRASVQPTEKIKDHLEKPKTYRR